MALYDDALQAYQQGAQNALTVQGERLRMPTPVQQFLEQLNIQRQRQIQQQQMANEAAYRNAMIGLGQQRTGVAAEHWQGMNEAALQRAAAQQQDVESKVGMRNVAEDVKQRLADIAKQKADAQNAWQQVRTAAYPGLVQSQTRANLARAGQSQAQTQKLQSEQTSPKVSDLLKFVAIRNKQISDENAANATTPGYQPKPPMKLDDAWQELQGLPAYQADAYIHGQRPGTNIPATPGGPGNVPGATPIQQQTANKYAPLIGTKTSKPDGSVLDDGTVVRVGQDGTITGFEVPKVQ